ncbi:MAG: cation diffusion facilitator family transporter [Cytophagaceae bacterium]
MSTSGSKIGLYGALLANLAIAVIKFIAAAVTGSSAMISEGIHSIIDTGNAVLLLYGIQQSKKLPDRQHPFGHGKELYFWTLIVGVLIFAIGGGMSVYEGITHCMAPDELEDPFWDYIVLLCSFIFEGISTIIILRELKAHKGDKSFWKAILQSKDPSVYAVMYENAADMIGILIAFLGVFLGHYLHNIYLDGIASILIGLMLGGVAVLLLRQSKSLLVGEAAELPLVESISEIVTHDAAVELIREPLTMHMSPDDVLLILDIRFKKGMSTEQVESAIDRMEEAIRHKHPVIKKIFMEANSIKESHVHE